MNEFHEPASSGDPSQLEVGQHAARALAWRTSGSFWPPVKELASLSLRFRSRLQTRLDLSGGDEALRSAQDKLLKRLQFMKWEYQSFKMAFKMASSQNTAPNLGPTHSAHSDEIDCLFEFFYSRAGFRLGQGLDAHLLDSSLSDREVAPPVAAMLLQILAETCGPSIEVLNLQSGRYLRCQDQLFDLFDQGRRLSRNERLELAQDSLGRTSTSETTTSAHAHHSVASTASTTSTTSTMSTISTLSAASAAPTASETSTVPLRDLSRGEKRSETPIDLRELSALTPDRAYVLMLTRLRQLSTKMSPPVIECELMLLDELIRYAPSQVALLAERGVLRSRLQQWQGALDDLNRFFAFHRREDVPLALSELHDRLRRELSQGIPPRS